MKKHNAKLTANMRPIAKVIQKLSGVKKQGKAYIALCPAHDDHNPSLKVSEGRDGRALIHCHAGCKIDKILGALEMKPMDLFIQKAPEIVCKYKYQDEKGKERYQIVRTNPKGFYIRRTVNGKFVYNAKGIEFVPYNLQKLIFAVENCRTVIIVEGEKDVDNLIKLGLVATTFCFGLKWRKHYAKYFKNAKVVIIADNDKVGHEKALIIAIQLYEVAKFIKIVELEGVPDKGDVSDWLESGGTKQELIDIIKKTPKWSPPEIAELSEVEAEIQRVVDEFNKINATVLYRSNLLILQPDYYDPALERETIQLINPNALKQHFQNDQVIVGFKKDGSPITKDKCSVWLAHPNRRTYDGMVFAPGVEDCQNKFNLFRGFAIKPKFGSCDRYMQHIYEVIADGDNEVYDYILAFMADAVQLRPRPGVAIAILGQQGVGKGVFVNNFGALFGRHYTHITQPGHLTGRFNFHLAESLLVFVDEAFWAGDKSAEGILKGQITEPTTMLESKGRDPYPIKNHNRFIMASNNDWIIPAGLEERRFFVVRASNKYIQDREYFAAIQEEMQNGGREALLYYLQNYDLNDIDITKYPRTAELAKQKLLSMSLLDQFWYGILQEGELFKSEKDFDGKFERKPWGKGIVKTQVFYEAFIQFCKMQSLPWHGTVESFGSNLGNLVPKRQKKKRKGIMCYFFPPLQECRDDFDKRTQQEWDWPEVDED